MEVSPPLLMPTGDPFLAGCVSADTWSPGISGTASFLLKFVVNGTPLPHLP
jgi:hypothetical protein